MCVCVNLYTCNYLESISIKSNYIWPQSKLPGESTKKRTPHPVLSRSRPQHHPGAKREGNSSTVLVASPHVNV